jgi:hypothetical protein
MPISNNDMRQDAISQIKSASNDTFSNLSDDELFLISDIISFRKNNDWKIEIPSVKSLIQTIRYIFNVNESRSSGWF